MKNATPIRVAVLRCDGHAFTFGPLMTRVDPLVFARNYHAEYHFMIDAYRPDKLNTPRVGGIEVAKVWDADPARARRFQEICLTPPRICASVDDMYDGIDAAFINDCVLNGGDHLELAAPFLRRGIPTFVDKPFASTLQDAVRMTKLARRHKTPLFSSSILGFVNEAKHLKRRFGELPGPVRQGVVHGVGWKSVGGIIHGLTLAQAVFGAGVEWVECMGEGPLEYLLMHYKDGKEVLLRNAHTDVFAHFICDVFSITHGCPPKNGHLRSIPMTDPAFVEGAFNIVKAFKKMVRTREPPLPYENMLELIAIDNAGREAQKKRRRVYLESLAGWKG
jgi:hypothetical protein